MARTYTTVGWEDGTVLQPAKVTVQGTEYNVENEVVTGRTPINAQNLRKMDNEIKRIVEEDIPSVYDEKLLTISDTAPSECIEGDKYYNTTDNKIYTAIATDTWSLDGDTPIEGKLYVVFNEQSTYAYNGTTLVSVGGSSNYSALFNKPSINNVELSGNKSLTDIGIPRALNTQTSSTADAYSCNYVNNKISNINDVLNNIRKVNYYPLNTNITPTKDCYAEVTVSAYGWGYDGGISALSISKTGSPTVILESLGSVQGHNTIADNVTSFGIYRLNAGTTYSFYVGSLSGATGGQTGFVKTIDI